MALQFIVTETITHTITVDAHTYTRATVLVDRVLDGDAVDGRVLAHEVSEPERDVKRVDIINTNTA